MINQLPSFMGLFNVLNAPAICGQCSHSYTDRLQFKHGEKWQYEYYLGDELKWGDPRISDGEKRPGQVLVYGISELEGCPSCGFKNINEYQREHTYWDNEVEYDILLIDNILSSIRPLQDYDVYLVDDGNGGLGFPV